MSPEHAGLLRWGGLAAWLMVGVPVLAQGADGPVRLLVWTAAYLLFAAAFWVGTSGARLSRRTALALLLVEVGCVVALVLTLCNGFEGALLVLVAMQLGGLAGRGAGLAWIAAQSLVLGLAIGYHWSPRPALLLTPPYLGFQVLAFLAFGLLDREARGRAELALLNAELRAAREALAHTTRVAERLRIARELHDAVGHHLVALSLNLEVAAHQTEGPAREQVRLAQSLAKLLLTDVGEIVGTLGRDDGIDLRRALAALAAEMPRPRVHLEVPADFAVGDAELAHLLLRCSQEIVTNAAKHAGAENLWLALARDGEAIELRGRDDGRGANGFQPGRGLTGMRERLEQAGGRLTVETGPGRGFAVTARVPERRAP